MEATRADGDELADHEGGEEAADHIAETAEDADHEHERAELQPDLGIDVVVENHQRRGKAGEPAADGGRDDVDLAAVDAHQRHDLPVLRDGTDGGADVGAAQEQPQPEHADERHDERDDARAREAHVGDAHRAHGDADVAELDAERHRRHGLQENEDPTRHEKLVDGFAVEHGADDEDVQQGAGNGDEHDADGRCQQERNAGLVGKMDAVHADHDEFGVTDPDDVDDAEHQIEPQCQQGKQAREQKTIEQGLQEEDVELAIHGGGASLQIPR